MSSYEVLMTPDAILDLTELRDYISGVLLAPDTAREYIQHLREEVGTLERMPRRYALVVDEPWRSRGVRKMNVKNFAVYYRIDEISMRVYVLNVIYNRRDQLRAMAEADAILEHPEAYKSYDSAREMFEDIGV